MLRKRREPAVAIAKLLICSANWLIGIMNDLEIGKNATTAAKLVPATPNITREPPIKAKQKSISEVNSYVEEMIGGQRVVKVFNHEEVCKNEFAQINDRWRALYRYRWKNNSLYRRYFLCQNI